MCEHQLFFISRFEYKCEASGFAICVSIYIYKCNMQLVSNGFNILKMNGLIHVHMLIIEKIWKNQ